MRIMLDTNVMLDLLSGCEEFHRDALRIKAMGLYGDAELWVSAKSFNDVFRIMRRHCDRGGDEIQDIFLENLSCLHVCSADGSDVETPTKAKWPDFEDCLISRCADKTGADLLLTRDKRGFERASVKKSSPAEFFDWLEREYGIVYDEVDL